MAVGAIEPAFYERLLDGLGLTAEDLGGAQLDASRLTHMSGVLVDRFATRTRDEWAGVFAGVDACVAPVLSAAEAVRDPHLVARGTYLAPVSTGPVQPAAAPRFSRTPSAAGETAFEPGRHTEGVLRELGLLGDDPFGDGAVT